MTRNQQCESCGYTLKDEIIHGDHRLCERVPPWARVKHGSPEWLKSYEEALKEMSAW